MNTRTHKSLEWFGPPERNTLLHCALYWAWELVWTCEFESLSVLEHLSWICLATSCALPFIAQGGLGGTYKDTEPRHVGPGTNRRKQLMPVTPGWSPSVIISVVHTILICRGCILGNARVMMSVVHATAWAYRLPTEWTGTPHARWPGRRPSAEWTCLIKCWGGTSPASGMDRRHILSAKMQRSRGLEALR
jgi:hypothetical protein